MLPNPNMSVFADEFWYVGGPLWYNTWSYCESTRQKALTFLHNWKGFNFTHRRHSHSYDKVMLEISVWFIHKFYYHHDSLELLMINPQHYRTFIQIHWSRPPFFLSSCFFAAQRLLFHSSSADDFLSTHFLKTLWDFHCIFGYLLPLGYFMSSLSRSLFI